MAEVRQTELPPVAGNPLATDIYMVTRAGVTSRQTLTQLKSALGVSLSALGGAASGNNSDITSLSALTEALSVSQGGTGAKNVADARNNLGIRTVASRYIDGLELEWAANSVIVKPGAAYIAAAGITLEVTAPLTIALSGLTPATFYHVYYFAGVNNVASTELSVTAPVAATVGGYVKTGDASRRYLGSVLALTATTVQRFQQNGGKMYYNATGMGSAPFAVLTAGNATTATDVAVAGVVPVTAVSVLANAINGDTGVTARISNSDIGAISSTNCRQTVRPGASSELEILLTASRTFSYAFDSTPSSVLQIRVNAYNFRR